MLCRSLVVADELLHTKTIFVIHHTDCGGQAAVKMHDVLEKRVSAPLASAGLLNPLLSSYMNISRVSKHSAIFLMKLLHACIPCCSLPYYVSLMRMEKASVQKRRIGGCTLPLGSSQQGQAQTSQKQEF